MRRDNVIRVLGPIDLLTETGAQPIGSRHCRALLGMLVLGAGRAVSIDRLRAGLWGDSPPKSADNSLQTYVSRLRHVIGGEVLEHADHAYRLAVRRDQIDALRFEDLLLRATEFRSEPERCQALCREALALWRGDPFGDLYDDETFRLEAQRLEELRVGVMELEMEAELALGNYEIVVAELESAVEEHPYREHLWYLLIEALLRSERRVDAIRACHRLDRALSEVGVDAGDQLRRVEERILGVEATGEPGPNHPEHQGS
jgi:DNA-binding SARP family transcriptional activator